MSKQLVFEYLIVYVIPCISLITSFIIEFTKGDSSDNELR